MLKSLSCKNESTCIKVLNLFSGYLLHNVRQKEGLAHGCLGVLAVASSSHVAAGPTRPFVI